MRIFCFIFFIFNLSVSYAQKATLTDASEFNIRRDDFYILGKWKNWTAVYLRNGNEYKMLCFDQQGHKVKQFVLNELQEECEEVRLTPSGESISISWEKIEQKKKTNTELTRRVFMRINTIMHCTHYGFVGTKIHDKTIYLSGTCIRLFIRVQIVMFA